MNPAAQLEAYTYSVAYFCTVQHQFIHSLCELLSKKKSPVCEAFDSNVNNSNAVNNHSFSLSLSRQFGCKNTFFFWNGKMFFFDGCWKW